MNNALSLEDKYKNNDIALLWGWEWNVIENYYDVDVEITVKRYSTQVFLKRLDCDEEKISFSSSQVESIENENVPAAINGITNGHEEGVTENNNNITAKVVPTTSSFPEIRLVPTKKVMLKLLI